MPNDIDVGLVIERSNIILNEYRNQTQDVFMTSFKGLRIDGLYRRRLDFATARRILNLSINQLREKVGDE